MKGTQGNFRNTEETKSLRKQKLTEEQGKENRVIREGKSQRSKDKEKWSQVRKVKGRKDQRSVRLFES